MCVITELSTCQKVFIASFLFSQRDVQLDLSKVFLNIDDWIGREVEIIVEE